MPNGVSEYAARLRECITKSLAAKEAMKYADCRASGRSMEECMGIFAVAPVPLPEPNIPAREAVIALKSVREILLKHVEMLDNQIEKMGQ